MRAVYTGWLIGHIAIREQWPGIVVPHSGWFAEEDAAERSRERGAPRIDIVTGVSSDHHRGGARARTSRKTVLSRRGNDNPARSAILEDRVVSVRAGTPDWSLSRTPHLPVSRGDSQGWKFTRTRVSWTRVTPRTRIARRISRFMNHVREDRGYSRFRRSVCFFIVVIVGVYLAWLWCLLGKGKCDMRATRAWYFWRNMFWFCNRKQPFLNAIYLVLGWNSLDMEEYS
jgi:hypothetical protein